MEIKSFIVSIYFFANAIFVSAQIAGDYELNIDEARNDLYELKETILETHQNPFTYCTEEEFEEAFNLADSALYDDIGIYRFASIAAQFMNVLRDSHTGIDYQYLIDGYLSEDGRIPGLDIITLNDGIYVVQDVENIVPVGSKLLKFNRVPIEEMSAAVYRVTLAEGNASIATTRLKDALFPGIAPLFYEMLAWNLIEFMAPGDSMSTVIGYPAKTQKEWRKYNKENNVQAAVKKDNNFVDIDGVYQVQFIDSMDMAVLSVASFAYKSEHHFNKSMKRIFEIINERSVSEVVVDLRENPGGRANRAEKLLACLNVENVTMPSNIIMKQSTVSRDRMSRSTNRLSRLIMKVFLRNNESVKNFFRMEKLPIGAVDTIYYHYKNPIPKYAFKGKTELWINGRSASASVIFASVFQKKKRGIILGESCLGPPEGTWGNPAPYTLSETWLEISLSTVRLNTFNNFNNSGTPVLPDQPVEIDQNILQSGIDPYFLTKRKLQKAVANQ